MKNKNGFISMTLVYTFLILFLFLMTGILTSYNQRNKYYDIIEDKIKSEMNLTSFRNDTLYNTILKDNTAYPDNNDASPTVDSKDGIDFSKPVIKINGKVSNGEGLFFTGDTSYTKDNKAVYYFRGENVNNYIKIDGRKFQILRTDENGNVKVIEAADYGTTDRTYNDATGNKAVGFMYGTDEDENALTNVELYLKTHENINDSDIKKALIPSVIPSYLTTAYYCNDRTIDKTVTKISDITKNVSDNIYTINSDKVGYSKYTTVYYNMNRIINDKHPRFNCNREDSVGNYADYIESYAGLITLDEAIYSGIGYEETENQGSFVKNAITMTPAYYYYDTTTNIDKPYMYAISSGKVILVKANEKYILQSSSVYTIKGDIIISDGNGTSNNPYIVKGGS